MSDDIQDVSVRNISTQSNTSVRSMSNDNDYFEAAKLASSLKDLVDELYECMTERDMQGAKVRAVFIAEKALYLYSRLLDITRHDVSEQNIVTQTDQNQVSPPPPDRHPDYQ